MKAYAPSDRGPSAAVVVSQELLTATVTGLQSTKASTIFFFFAKYLCCQQAYNQGEKKLRQCSFFSKVFIFVLPAMVQPRRGKRLRQCSCFCIFFVPFVFTSYFDICPSFQESELWLQGEGKG